MTIFPRRLLVATTFFISMLIYLRASIDELSEENGFSEISQTQLMYLGMLAFFAGICEAIEVYDHLFPRAHAETPELIEVTEASASSSSSSQQALVATGAGLVLAPPLLACAWAHQLQGAELARSFGYEDEFFGWVLATPALVKFCTVAIPHLLHTLQGTRERFALSVTNNNVTDLPEISLPPLKWWLMLALLVYLHLPEGDLIASPIRDETIRQLAAFGFSLAESVPHLNQLEQLPRNLSNMLSQSTSSSYASMGLSVGAGMVGGLASASEALLAAMVGTRDRLTSWIAPLVEFLLGFAETQQHLVPAAQQAQHYLRHRLFTHENRAETSVSCPAVMAPSKRKH